MLFFIWSHLRTEMNLTGWSCWMLPSQPVPHHHQPSSVRWAQSSSCPGGASSMPPLHLRPCLHLLTADPPPPPPSPVCQFLLILSSSSSSCLGSVRFGAAFTEAGAAGGNTDNTRSEDLGSAKRFFTLTERDVCVC